MLTVRNSVHKSTAFGRNCFSHRTSRKGDSSTCIRLGSCSEPSKTPKDLTDAFRSKVDFIPNDNDEQILVPEVFSGLDHVRNSVLIGAVGSEAQNTKDSETELCLKSDSETCSRFGEWNKSESLGLAYVKSGLALSSTDISENSEIIALELCAESNEGTRLERYKNIPDGGLERRLDQSSSMTDSSGVETSSDIDSENPLFTFESSENSLKGQNFDIVDHMQKGYEDKDYDHCYLENSTHWDHAQSASTGFSSKKKTESQEVYEKDRYVMSDSVKKTSFYGKKCFQKQHNIPLPESVVKPAFVNADEFLKLEENVLSYGSFPVNGHESKFSHIKDHFPNSLSVRCETSDNASLAMEDIHTDNVSIGSDEISNHASLSKPGYHECVHENDWTVVKAGRRTKGSTHLVNEQNMSYVVQSKQGFSVEDVQCSTHLIRDSFWKTNSQEGNWSSCNLRSSEFEGPNFDHSNCNGTVQVVLQNIKEKDMLYRNVGKCILNNRSNFKVNNMGENSGSNSNNFVLLNGNQELARFKEIHRVNQRSHVNEFYTYKNCAVDAIDSCGTAGMLCNTVDKIPFTELSVKKPCLSHGINKAAKSSDFNISTAGKTFCKDRRFELLPAQIFLYREYEDAVAEHSKKSCLIATYDADMDDLHGDGFVI